MSCFCFPRPQKEYIFSSLLDGQTGRVPPALDCDTTLKEHRTKLECMKIPTGNMLLGRIPEPLLIWSATGSAIAWQPQCAQIILPVVHAV